MSIRLPSEDRMVALSKAVFLSTLWTDNVPQSVQYKC